MKKRSAIALTLKEYFYPTAFALSFAAVFTVLFYFLWSSSVDYERSSLNLKVDLIRFEVRTILAENERDNLIRWQDKEPESSNRSSVARDFLSRHPEVLAITDRKNIRFYFREAKDSATFENDSTTIETVWSLVKKDSVLTLENMTGSARFSKPVKLKNQFYFAALAPVRINDNTRNPIILLYSADNVLREALRRHSVEGCEASLFSSSGERIASTGFPNAAVFLRIQKTVPGYEGIFSADISDPDYMFWDTERILTALVCAGFIIIVFVVFREMLVDVEKLKKAASDLRSSEEQFRTVFEKSADALRVMDRYGRIVMANSAYCDLVGRSYEELLREYNEGDDNLEGRNGGTSAFRGQFDARTLKMATSQVIKRSDGKEIPVEIRHSFFTVANGRKLLLSIFHDVTERRQHELESQQVQKMDALGEFAVGIGNTLKNIAGIVMNSAEILNKEATTSPTLVEYMNIIFRESKRAAELADDLLVFARSKESDAGPIHVQKLLHQAAKILESALSPGISLAVSPEKSEAVIRGDVHQMHQVIVNLALAAQSRMPEGGRIGIQSSIVPGERVKQKFPSAHADSFVLISVTDNGKELEEYAARRIFEPFFDSKVTDPNAGLRMSVAYSIVHSHKGFIEVESGKGAGTNVSLYLPLEISHATVDKAAPPNVLQRGSECILVVDDEDSYRQIYQQGLSSLGYRIFSAGDGEEAVAAYVEHRGKIDLVVSDFKMPKMNGEELFHKLREIDPAAKFILATGAIDLKEKSHLMKIGVEEVLEKPFLLDEMLASVRKALDRV